MSPPTTNFAAGRGRERGVSLIELLVALVIGSILIIGALTVFIDSRATYRVNQSVSRMQENGLFALDEMARSLQLAGYWGENNTANRVVGRTIRSGGAISQTSPMNNATNECRVDWYTDLERPVEGLDATPEGVSPPADDANEPYKTTCISDARYQIGTDILVVRHVEPAAVPTASLQANTAYVRADPNQAQLFIGPTEPGGFASTARNYLLTATAFYVSPYSEAPGDGIPALKRAALRTGTGGNPLVYVPAAPPNDAEDIVIPGIENLQVQFGIDTDGDGSANQYRNAGNVGATQWDNVRAVRIWIIVRAEDAEPFFQNNQSYAMPQGNFAKVDGFRRLLLTRTVQIRN